MADGDARAAPGQPFVLARLDAPPDAHAARRHVVAPELAVGDGRRARRVVRKAGVRRDNDHAPASRSASLTAPTHDRFACSMAAPSSA